MRAQRGISRLESWLRSQGFTLCFSNKAISYVDFEDMQVVVNSRYRPGSQLAQLAHECGHILITDEEIDARFSKGYPLLGNSRYRHNLVHRITVVEEEVEAWKRGEDLLKSMNINYDKDVFAACKAKSLKSYFKWTCRAKLKKTISN